jgi:hypothetical protein
MHIDAKWDLFLDDLPDPTNAEGYESEGRFISPAA